MARSPEGDRFHTGAVIARIMALAQTTEAKILVVDDDELELALLSDRLESCGLMVHRANNGAEALQLLEKEWFPVILTDWQMPVMNGVELTEQVRARGVTDTFVIMLTVLERDYDYERAYQAGVDDYLSKKRPEVELLARIHAAFSTVKLRKSLQEANTKLQGLST
ncbi:MAG: response regulator [Sinobacteraceae bacterium]|nr:response regulator [Nevskiaceae bacterium]